MAKKQLTAEEVRRNIDQVFDECGGATQVAAACMVSYPAAFNWKKKGNLNGARVETAIRFAKLAGKPLETFLVDL